MPTNETDHDVRNGRDLVGQVLNHPQGGIDGLLQLAERQETDWLEFKAALHPIGGRFEPGEVQADCDWHVAEAAVAMSNSVGGAVILGLDDNLQPVGLKPSDPNRILDTKGREAFNRDVVQKALICDQWKTGRRGTIRLEGNLQHQIEIINADYQGHPLTVILVSPVLDEDFLEVCETHNHRERILIPVRARGAVGQVRDLQGRKEIRDHEQARKRQLEGDDYNHLWQRFQASVTDETEPKDLIDAAVETALADYNAACVTNLRGLRDLFTPLDLEETRASNAGPYAGEFVPEADEWRDLFASDDPWDTHEADGDDDDEEGDDTEIEETIPKQPVAPPRRGSVFELLAQEPRAILLGEPGAGKSTCLQRLALERAEGYQTGAPVALYVPLRLYTKQGLTALLARSGKQPWPVLEALIHAERLHLLLDAVNECPRHLQERCCQDIKALLDAHPTLPVLLTARNLSYRCELRLPTFIVRPLDREHQQRFLTAYLHGDVSRATQLLDQIQNQPGGALIASNPLLLSIVVKVSRAEGELPRGRALLYRRFFEDWYQREDKKEAQTGAPLRWAFPRTLEALATLALAARQAGRIEMERTWAERTLRPLLADDAVPFLERIAQGLLLQLDADQDSLSFTHESVQEYLAAEQLLRYPDALPEWADQGGVAWRIPLAYTFELAESLPESFVQSAWRSEPLLVTAALRSDLLLNSLTIDKNWSPWLRGILRILRKENPIEEGNCIIKNKIYPPVDPLPEKMVEMLTGDAFWYAGITHDLGNIRINFLWNFVNNYPEPWLELFPIIYHRKKEWIEELTDAQQIFIRCVEGSYRGSSAPKNNMYLHALDLVQVNYLRRHNFLPNYKIEKMSFRQLSRLVESHSIRADEIPKDSKQYYISEISSKILSKPESISGLTIDQIMLFLQAGNIIPSETVSGIKKHIINSLSSISQIIFFAQNKAVIEYKEIPVPNITKIINKSNSWQVVKLIENVELGGKEIIRILRIKSQSSEIITNAAKERILASINSPAQAIYFTKAKIINKEEIPYNVKLNFINSSNIRQIINLIEVGILNANDIPENRMNDIINRPSKNKLESIRKIQGMGVFLKDEIIKPVYNFEKKKYLKNKNHNQRTRIHPSNEKPQKLIEKYPAMFVDQEIVCEKESFEKNPPLQSVSSVNIDTNILKFELGQHENCHYTIEEIQDEVRRKVVMNKLNGILWEMVVVHVNSDGSHGFSSHANFPSNVFFLKQRLDLSQDVPLRKGDILEAEIVILFNKKREEWNFAIKQGKRTQSTEGDIPNWWQAWQFFAPRWEMAADGQYLLKPELFNKLHSEGFDTQALRNWKPTDKDGRRIKLANHLVQLALNELPEQLPLRKQHIAQQLAGDGIWADLRLLAGAYIDGKRMLSPLKTTPITKPNTSKGKSEPANRTTGHSTFKASYIRQIQKRRLEGEQLLSDLRIATKPQTASQFDFEEFIGKSQEFTLYIDESWAGPKTAIQDNEGVIAGLICRGAPGQVISHLPSIATHSYKAPLTARQAIESLLACSRCRPFIFPIRMARQDQLAIKYYDLLLQYAIRLLCGWLIKPSVKTRLSVFCERIFEHQGGDDGTDFIQGGLSVNPERFEIWKLATVRWEDKEFGYIPYADLLAHLALEHTDVNRALGTLADFKNLPGYVPFSLELVPRLERLEHLETSANLGDVIDFALETGDSPFGRLVMRDLAKRLAQRADLQQRLLETLEDEYRNKVRDLRRLRQAFNAVRGLLPALSESASPRMRLLWYLLALQDANHDGDPERIRASAGDYLQERETLKQSDRELCADADLNLAVHYADRFAFGHAEVTVGEWIYDPLFPALSLRQQGRFYSALGQYRAMQGDAQGADGFFVKALDLFSQAPLTDTERADESEQTSIYRAINALDGSLRVVPQALEALFGAMTPALAEQFASDGSLKRQYRHHLLLRALTLRPELDEARLAYLAARDRWQEGYSQHPWPSIHGYRGFLLWNQEEPADEQIDQTACAAFDRAIELAALDQHGPTVKLIGALWATVAACCYDDSAYVATARRLLDLARMLPDAESAIATLEDVLAAPDAPRIGEAFAALPFNYR